MEQNPSGSLTSVPAAPNKSSRPGGGQGIKTTLGFIGGMVCCFVIFIFLFQGGGDPNQEILWFLMLLLSLFVLFSILWIKREKEIMVSFATGSVIILILLLLLQGACGGGWNS